MNDWQLRKLDDLGTVERGRSRHRPRNDPALYGGAFPFVQTGDIKAAGLRLFKFQQTYNDAGLAQSRLWPAGTLCITIAANIADTAILGIPACFPDSVIGFTPHEDVADVRFVKYALDLAKRRFEAISRGATQDNLSLDKLLSQRILVPDINEQRRIADVLSVYDDLIEANCRRVVLLEQMARGLFEEWFVRFRFPGHEGVTIHETLDGPLPEGWEFGSASRLIDFDPLTRLPKDGAKPFISMGHLKTTVSLIAPFELRGGNSGAKFSNGDTLIARITPCLENGKTGLVRHLPGNGLGFGSTEFIVMRGTSAGPAYTYCLARFPDFRRHAERGMTGASGRQRTRTEIVSRFRVAIPPQELLEAFERVAWPLLDLVGELGRANERLSASRDLLLPRLISGRLALSAASEVTAEAATTMELVVVE